MTESCKHECTHHILDVHSLLSMPKRRSSRTTKAPSSVHGRRERNKAAARQRILAAALELFQRRGFDATTTKEIARRAKVAEGTVFNYFATKDDIALYFFQQEVDHAIGAVRDDARLRKAPLEEKLFALVQSQLEFLAPYERFIGSSLVEALKPGSSLGPFSARMQDLHHQYLAFVEELMLDSIPPRRRKALGWFAPQAFWIFYLVVLLYWLNDTSKDKQSTMAFLDRSLKLGAAVFARGDLA